MHRIHIWFANFMSLYMAWNKPQEYGTAFLPNIGFQSTYLDSSLFVKKIGSDIVILVPYVDDIIITMSYSSVIHHVINSLTSEFDIKDLGDLHYFLGIQITSIKYGLFLSSQSWCRICCTKLRCLILKVMIHLIYHTISFARMMGLSTTIPLHLAAL